MCTRIRTTYNEERFINVWNVSTQGGISLLNYVYIGYIIPLYQLIRPSFHDLTERVKICNFSILSFTHICTLFT